MYIQRVPHPQQNNNKLMNERKTTIMKYEIHGSKLSYFPISEGNRETSRTFEEFLR
jgi:hypothetical protein